MYISTAAGRVLYLQCMIVLLEDIMQRTYKTIVSLERMCVFLGDIGKYIHPRLVSLYSHMKVNGATLKSKKAYIKYFYIATASTKRTEGAYDNPRDTKERRTPYSVCVGVAFEYLVSVNIGLS